MVIEKSNVKKIYEYYYFDYSEYFKSIKNVFIKFLEYTWHLIVGILIGLAYLLTLGISRYISNLRYAKKSNFEFKLIFFPLIENKKSTPFKYKSIVIDDEYYDEE